jgi:hypothetical protein
MKTHLKKGFIFTAACLLAFLSFSVFHENISGRDNAHPGNSRELREKKITILPILVMGGIRYFQKTFDKKN